MKNTYKNAKKLIFLLILTFIFNISTVSAQQNHPFTFVWMTDTQYYSEKYPHIYERITDWIAQEAQADNIRYVFHTGDIVNHHNKEKEWINAHKAMKTLDTALVPYGVLAGNHDVAHDELNYKHFSHYFGEKRFKNRSYYKGTYENNRAHYDEIKVSSHQFLMLHIGYGLNDDVLSWAKTVIDEHPKHTVIIATHRYLKLDGSRSGDGEKLFQTLILPSPNVQLVLSGHYSGTAQKFDRIDDDGDGKTDRTVVQLLTDYQRFKKGGNGFIRLLSFNPNLQTVTVDTFSPYTDEHTLDHKDVKQPMSFHFRLAF
ncbi:metallophosphoesterase [Shouchella lonarensis]|uniref:Calcineurin-like phosphoesterase n=1 Tax=Shouchella lonarensis TaxID=1464122 RepID=A0A1G6HVJ7_9BACI|nr:metallophosphoesterase [Shouchella lonarensis]SDB98282.1 Calcineurin-like phosphoesterase [Shouchella lonarensis]